MVVNTRYCTCVCIAVLAFSICLYLLCVFLCCICTVCVCVLCVLERGGEPLAYQTAASCLLYSVIDCTCIYTVYVHVDMWDSMYYTTTCTQPHHHSAPLLSWLILHSHTTCRICILAFTFHSRVGYVLYVHSRSCEVSPQYPCVVFCTYRS